MGYNCTICLRSVRRSMTMTNTTADYMHLGQILVALRTVTKDLQKAFRAFLEAWKRSRSAFIWTTASGSPYGKFLWPDHCLLLMTSNKIRHLAAGAKQSERMYQSNHAIPNLPTLKADITVSLGTIRICGPSHNVLVGHSAAILVEHIWISDLDGGLHVERAYKGSCRVLDDHILRRARDL